ncbi:MAG TPA: YbaL family putative K(+) efflux transporter [Hyphomicrobiaceae bacterium]|jgi:CPA2 family monovalent cation:H+ antiporter-2|nr:YbaL family putative K(+) efflux transporter [Hyphomicrobiaceae bacterium]
MPHHTPLISTIVVALVLAFVLGATANRFRVSPLVGYLLAGVLIGPFTPGYVADQGIARDLAEIGVILLMFGVGLHFTLEDLLSVRAIAVPGALVQIASATLLGMGLAWLLGWPMGAGLVFGLALSVASTVVLLKALQERRLVDTERGRIAVGWLVVEDFAMILALVLIPSLAGILQGNTGVGATALVVPVLITLAKVAAFVAVMLVIGKRLIPALLHWVAHSGSRELFRLAVLAIALGVAYEASQLFDVSFALGAFFAGMILSESELSQRAAQESLPLRDAFAVLFFVSAGMLVDPTILLRDPLPLIATLLIIVLGKSVAAFLIVRLFGYPTHQALTISVSLAQIGELSFILAGLGVSMSLLPERGRDLILAGAIISILLNPVLFAAVDRYLAKGKTAEPASGPDTPERAAETATREPIPPTTLSDHVVLVGYGRVGRVVTGGVQARRMPLLLIEENKQSAAEAMNAGAQVISGTATDREVLAAANLAGARCLLVAIPDAFEGGQVVAQARAINPSLYIIARSHSDEETEHLKKHGASKVIMGEHETARAMLGDLPPRTR